MSLLPGLPAMPSGFSALFADLVLLTSDSAGAFPGGATPQWGIFLDGEAVVLADNVVSVDFKQDFAISNYPLEGGAFASYNKVQKPFEVRLRFSAGGSDSDREAFFNSITAIIGDVDLYEIVTPEVTYQSVNLIHQDYRRTATEGAGLVSIDVWCQQVRATAQAASSNVAAASSGSGTSIPGTNSFSSGSPNAIVSDDFAAINNPQPVGASPQINGGTAFPQTPTAAQQSAASAVLAQSSLPF